MEELEVFVAVVEAGGFSAAAKRLETTPAAVSRRIKGGLILDLMGVDAFLPGSQVALRQVPNLEDLNGQEIERRFLRISAALSGDARDGVADPVTVGVGPDRGRAVHSTGRFRVLAP